MYRNLFLLLSIFHWASFELQAITTSLDGEALEEAGKEIYLLRFEDQVSRRWVILDTQTVDDQGYFRFDIDLETTELLSIRSGNWFADLYVTPGKDIQIELARSDRRVRNFTLNPWVLTSSSQGLNQSLAELYRAFNAVRDSSSQELIMHLSSGSKGYRASRKDELLRTGMISEEDTTSQQSAQIQAQDRFYMAYDSLKENWSDHSAAEIAVLEAAAGRMARACGRDGLKLAKQWLGDYESNWANPEWTTFCEEVFWDEYIRDEEKGKIDGFLTTGNLDSLSQRIVNYQISQQIGSEIVPTLFLIRHHWFLDDESRRGCLRVLSLMEDPMAERMKKELTAATTFAAPFLPDLTLVNYKGDRVNLSEFEEDLVYLNVVKLNSASCAKELGLMANLERKYGRQIRFITIVMDDDPKAITNFLAKNRNYEWEFLQGTNNPVLQRALNLRTIPAFFLVQPNGTLRSSYTKMPSEGIEETFARLLKAPEENRIKYWDD